MNRRRRILTRLVRGWLKRERSRRIRGKRYSFASIEMTVGGVKLEKVRGISWTEPTELSKQNRVKSLRSFTATGTFTLAGDAREALLDALTARETRGWPVYAYSLYDADKAGVKQHPAKAILELAPDAVCLIPESLFDCWTFQSLSLVEAGELPTYVRPIGEPTQTMLNIWAEEDARHERVRARQEEAKP